MLKEVDGVATSPALVEDLSVFESGYDVFDAGARCGGELASGGHV